MQTFEPGVAARIVVPFERDGEPFLPASGSVKWTLRDHEGSIVTGYNAKAETPAPTDTFVLLTVNAPETAIDPDRRFEKRTIILEANVGPLPWSRRIVFRLADFLNHSVDEGAVRSKIGVGVSELPDSDIDLWAAYMDVETAVTKDVLDAALASGSAAEDAANIAIRSRAVLAALPALSQRIFQKRSDGSINVTRNKLDIDAIRGAALDALNEALNTITGRQFTAIPMFAFASGTDVITGA